MIDLESIFHTLQADREVTRLFKLQFTGRVILMKNREHLVYIDNRMVKVQKRHKRFFGGNFPTLLWACHQEESSLMDNLAEIEMLFTPASLAI